MVSTEFAGLTRGMKMAEEAERKEAEQRKDDPMSSLPEDSKLGIQRMLEMARDDPLHYLEDDAKERVQKARHDLRCSVCGTILQDAFQTLKARPKSLQSEHEILTIMEKICEGGADRSLPSYFGIDPPPLPPRWTDHWRPVRTEKGFVLKGWKKGAAKRQKWRKLAEEGKQKPVGIDENEQAGS